MSDNPPPPDGLAPAGTQLAQNQVVVPVLLDPARENGAPMEVTSRGAQRVRSRVVVPALLEPARDVGASVASASQNQQLIRNQVVVPMLTESARDNGTSKERTGSRGAQLNRKQPVTTSTKRKTGDCGNPRDIGLGATLARLKAENAFEHKPEEDSINDEHCSQVKSKKPHHQSHIYELYEPQTRVIVPGFGYVPPRIFKDVISDRILRSVDQLLYGEVSKPQSSEHIFLDKAVIQRFLDATRVTDSPRRLVDSLVRILTENEILTDDTEPSKLLYNFLLHELLRNLMQRLSVKLETTWIGGAKDFPLYKCLEPAMKKIRMPHLTSRIHLAWDTAYERARKDALVICQAAKKGVGKALSRLNERRGNISCEHQRKLYALCSSKVGR